MILCQLADGERSVGQLTPLVGLSQSALSQHLAVLREEGIVATRREAQTIWYSIADPAALKVVATLAERPIPAAAAAFIAEVTDEIERLRTALQGVRASRVAGAD